MTRFPLSFFASLFAALLLTSCRDNTPGDPNELDVAWTIATFTGNVDDRAQFQFRVADDSPIITLTAQRPVETSDDLTPPCRVYIAYIPASGNPCESGPVTLTAVSPITSSAVKTAGVTQLAGWDADPVYLLTAWRSGEYLNIYCRLPYDREPRRFALLVDESTIASGRPQLYLCHELPREVNTFMRAYYASFDISSLISDPSVTTLDLHINNSNLPTSLYTFPLGTSDK